MKNNIIKIFLGAFLFVSGIAFSQVPTPPVTPLGDDGAPDETPIDMYIVYLAVVAVAMIVFYANKKRKIA